MEYLTTNKILLNVQSAFCKGFNTSMVLIKVRNDITRSMDDDKIIYLCLLDYSKAWHQIYKLETDDFKTELLSNLRYSPSNVQQLF